MSTLWVDRLLHSRRPRLQRRSCESVAGRRPRGNIGSAGQPDGPGEPIGRVGLEAQSSGRIAIALSARGHDGCGAVIVDGRHSCDPRPVRRDGDVRAGEGRSLAACGAVNTRAVSRSSTGSLSAAGSCVVRRELRLDAPQALDGDSRWIRCSPDRHPVRSPDPHIVLRENADGGAIHRRPSAEGSARSRALPRAGAPRK